jgi:hypothetical protein
MVPWYSEDTRSELVEIAGEDKGNLRLRPASVLLLMDFVERGVNSRCRVGIILVLSDCGWKRSTKMRQALAAQTGACQ